jgi:hypothetical protein
VKLEIDSRINLVYSFLVFLTEKIWKELATESGGSKLKTEELKKIATESGGSN